MNNWEKLCKQVDLLDKNVEEERYHKSFETYLQTIFNWDEVDVGHKVSMQNASKKQADIVLAGNDFTLVIEMKRPNVELGADQIGQLVYYMRNLPATYQPCRYGFLIGNKIEVIYDDGKKPQAEVKSIASFGFDPNNKDGEALGEILDKNICSNDKLYQYVTERMQAAQEKEEVERLRSELNQDKIKTILRDKLIAEGHREETVDKVLDNIKIYLSDIDSGTIDIHTTGNGIEDSFEKWMIGEDDKQQAVARSYRKAIEKFSEYLSNEIGQSVNIYTIDDPARLRSISTECRKGGKYANKGAEAHGLIRAAIAAYVRFLEQLKDNP